MELFHVKFIDQGDTKLAATSNWNYALASPKLAARNWQSVSVNGDDVVAIGTDGGQRIVTTKTELGLEGVQFIESLRDEIADGNWRRPTSSSAATTAGSLDSSGFAMSSGTGLSSATLSSGGVGETTSVSSSSNGPNGMSFSVRDQNNFSVSKSDLPFRWSRVLLSGELVILVSKGGEVQMAPLASLEPDQREAIERLRRDVVEMQRSQQEQFSNTMKQSMDMVSNVFANIMSNFPRPPDYSSSVGDLFGDSFPFGPNNSPFNSWPFGGSTGGAGGAGAFAFAGLR